MMKLDINGETKQLLKSTSLEQLIQQMGLNDRRLAVELNFEVVPRSQYGHVQLNEGDRIEIVHAIGGG